jgi:hypothetical protein
MGPALALMKEAGTVNVLSDRITMEYVLEKMSKGFPKMHIGSNGTGPPVGQQAQTLKLGIESSALIASSELSVFITASQFSIKALTDLWDSKEGVYGYGTRGKGEHNIKDACVSLLGASAQDWLVKTITTEDVGGGFTRRVNFVLATRKDHKVPWPQRGKYKTALLADDLRQMSILRGQFDFTPKAKLLFEDYYNASEPEDFDDEATANFKVSKWANATKLAQVLSVSRGDDLVINEQDFTTAMDRIEEITKDLKLVFRSVGESDLASSSEHVIRFMEMRGFVSRNEIMKHNWRHFTSNELDVILATFREAGMIYERTQGQSTLYAWKEKEDNKKP